MPLSQNVGSCVLKQNPCQGGVVDFETWRTDPVGRSGEELSTNYGKSPFPSLEVFIEAIACIGGIQGRYSDPFKLVLSI